MPSKLSLDYESIGRNILRSEVMGLHMRDRALRILLAAHGRAPVYEGPGRDEHRGRYRSSFRIESTSRGGVKHDRAEATVINDAPEAVFVEFGARAYKGIPARPAQHILGSSMMAAAGDE